MKKFLVVALALFMSTSAYAQLVSSKADSKLPVEISSDSLEVQQHQNTATFKGNVVAVQGTTRIKSDIMIVHYKSKDEPAAKPAKPAPAAGAAGAMGAITLIEVQGNVFVATPEESAKGDKGDYHVDQRTIHLFGDNVTLTRGKNILKGTSLEYNLDTGKSVLSNNGATVNSAGGGRVRGVFVPNEEPGKSDKK